MYIIIIGCTIVFLRFSLSKKLRSLIRPNSTTTLLQKSNNQQPTIYSTTTTRSRERECTKWKLQFCQIEIQSFPGSDCYRMYRQTSQPYSISICAVFLYTSRLWFLQMNRRRARRWWDNELHDLFGEEVEWHGGVYSNSSRGSGIGHTSCWIVCWMEEVIG